MMAEMTAYKVLKATYKKKKDAMPYHHRLTHQSPAAFKQNLRNIRKADRAAQIKRAGSLMPRHKITAGFVNGCNSSKRIIFCIKESVFASYSIISPHLCLFSLEIQSFYTILEL
ncbi:hypothetical protein [Streptococcus equi]|uniref:Uncharacterized protein n=1 Tax=Streptococcus equi subsp. ruminatorum TaxID=254358 RepID=A0A6M1KQH1_9STRE|nr:hypothetical protein [Streptococcus equi]NGL83446.1 hypothetical protein [Streptococcus equi subsp. ruminatorum]